MRCGFGREGRGFLISGSDHMEWLGRRNVLHGRGLGVVWGSDPITGVHNTKAEEYTTPYMHQNIKINIGMGGLPVPPK